jgi:S1-C subfamily serine protease
VDPLSDIAVIKIDANNLSAAKLADSAQTRVGEFAIAIGAPFELDYSVTFGHVSAKGRSNIIPSFMEGGLGASMDQDFIQTDASINPGNSGGPLVNLSGEVIGVNTIIRGLNTGIGFAIASNLAKDVAEKLISEGRYRRGWLGIMAVAVKDNLDYQQMLPEGTEGVVVDGIPPKGPAAKSDLKPGDVITKVAGRPVSTVPQLRTEVRSQKIGDTVPLDVIRNGKNIKVKIQTEELPNETEKAETKPFKPQEAETQKLGVSVQTMTRDFAEQYGIDQTQGVVVTAVERNSLAESKQLRPGDVITEVNHKPVTSAKQFKAAVKDADLKKGIVINLIRRGVSRFVFLKDSGD